MLLFLRGALYFIFVEIAAAPSKPGLSQTLFAWRRKLGQTHLWTWAFLKF
jgi:hypothetical protein